MKAWRKKPVKEGKSIADRGIFVRHQGTPEDLEQNTKCKEYLLDAEFYVDIWDEREHSCFETGKPLTEEPLTLYFHHILPKAKYPQYRYEKWNIVLLHPDAHSQVETFIDKCPRVKALTEHLKIVYG